MHREKLNMCFGKRAQWIKMLPLKRQKNGTIKESRVIRAEVFK